METSAYQSVNIDTAFQTMIQGNILILNKNNLEIFGKFHKQLEDSPDEFNIREEKAVDINLLNHNIKVDKKGCC